ncbi:hypothetical protein [Candidatus Nitrotoga sp. M5]|uniref:hypothetical protein n=1 Tax=Candidatus Nitrotoga sp. M5 TaxID=2890409 RepID=UPI001EF42950|nr:hypothetical protein [Candidatus Nitrotoga sp. M5]CAH1387353.1 conserved hypothetical protein [Candidatus Nitrotoga sp. M5]
MVLKIGLLPIILGIVLLGFFAAKAARMRGKNPLIWGSITVAVITAVTWQQIPVWSETIFYRGQIKQATIPQRKVISLAEAKEMNFRVSMDGVNFDVPLTYNLKGYNQQLHGWGHLSQKKINGKERPAVDFIIIDAMLPDLSPLKEENLAQFEKLAWRQNLHASITHTRPWDQYFKYFFERLQRQPESTKLPGMLHYYDPSDKADIFLSHAYPTDELIRIRCADESFFHNEIPICIIENSYHPAPNVAISEPIKGKVFFLRYELPSQYITQWQTIDKKLKSRLDQMVSINAPPLP